MMRLECDSCGSRVVIDDSILIEDMAYYQPASHTGSIRCPNHHNEVHMRIVSPADT